MTVAARLDDYSDFGSTVNPQFGLMWRPVPDLLLRGLMAGASVRPHWYELRSPRQCAVQHFSARSGARNDAVTNVTFLVGGNPDLRPIEADSLTAGFVLTPTPSLVHYHFLCSCVNFI